MNSEKHVMPCLWSAGPQRCRLVPKLSPQGSSGQGREEEQEEESWIGGRGLVSLTLELGLWEEDTLNIIGLEWAKVKPREKSINSKNFSFPRYQNRWCPGFRGVKAIARRRCWRHWQNRGCFTFSFLCTWLHVGACCQRETWLSSPDLAMPEVVNLLGIINTHVSEISHGFVIITYFESSPSEALEMKILSQYKQGTIENHFTNSKK